MSSREMLADWRFTSLFIKGTRALPDRPAAPGSLGLHVLVRSHWEKILNRQ